MSAQVTKMNAVRTSAKSYHGGARAKAVKGARCSLARARSVSQKQWEERRMVQVASNASGTDADAESELPIEKSSTSFDTVMDIDAIMKILPHRYPFLLVDRVVEYEQGKHAVGMKNVTVNDNFFTGHFPTRPIMPGVLIVEALAQVGGIAMMDPDDPKENFFFGGIDGCKFRKPVVPGDTLMLKVGLKKMNKRFGVAKMEAKAFVGENLVCEAELTLYMGN